MILSNNQLKRYRLLKQKKNREKEGLFVIEGKKMVMEAILYFPDLIENIICTENILNDLSENWKSNALTTDYDTLSKLSSLTTPQEIIGIVIKPDHNELTLQSLNNLTLALENVVDPGNLGTIIRMADWFGIENILCSTNCVDCYNPKVVQATMGGIFRVNIHYINLSVFLSNAIKNKITVYGTTLDGENIYIELISFPSILVMGNESTGLSHDIKKIINKNLFIPHFSESSNTSESLNVSTATAIALSEFRRQQFYSK